MPSQRQSDGQVGQPPSPHLWGLGSLDAGLDAYEKRPLTDNRGGNLAWGESYFLSALAETYLATGDKRYKDRLSARFERVLALRDDRVGKGDAFAKRPLAGWGAEKYSKGQWHVWIAHTGMLLQGPARLGLHTKAICESLADTESYWRDGPGKDEGYFYDPYLEQLLPLNQQNALGSVLVTLQPERAAKLARFFKNRLRRPEPDRYDWGYWPKETDDEPKRSEDISHAGLNVAFAALCCEKKLVFDKRDMLAFAHTWLRAVRRDESTWADLVSGAPGKSNTYRPAAVAEWLPLLSHLPPPERKALYDDARTALSGPAAVGSPRGLLGLARLLRGESL